MLAERLGKREQNSIVLAIVRGGTPVGRVVAVQRGLPFDIVLIRRLVAPGGPGSELCGVSVAGTLVLDEGIADPNTPETPFQFFLKDALAEFRSREKMCRAGRAPQDIAGKHIILVDCAIHTGSTMRIAIGGIRRLNPARIVAAVPVASPEGVEHVKGLADDLVCLERPSPFGHAGMWYEDFKRPDYEDTHQLLIHDSATN